ncbi:MAG: hypothetical protein ABIX28_00170 [Vicinamibacterales bacterium]
MPGTALALTVTMLLAAPAARLTPVRLPVAAQDDGGQRVNRDAKVMAEFEERVKAYSTLHRELEATIPSLPREATPQQINSHQMALAALIAKTRAKASVGDLFTKDVRALFRRYLARVFQGPQGRDLRASIMDDNPGRLRLHINARYPESIPVPSVPPQVLQALPKLPEDLEYRFIGDRLILHDVHAHTIVDLIDDAIPH